MHAYLKSCFEFRSYLIMSMTITMTATNKVTVLIWAIWCLYIKVTKSTLPEKFVQPDPLALLWPDTFSRSKKEVRWLFTAASPSVII